MFFRMMTLVCCMLVSQLGFAKPLPVPPSKSAYVGHWQGKQMQLNISPDGKIEYKRNQPGKNINMNIELLRFDGDNFDAGADTGFMKMSSTFVVSQPPHRDGGKWKMVVDGVELTRVE